MGRKLRINASKAIYKCKQLHVLITEPTGAEKTFVGCALADQACEQHQATKYFRLSRLLDDLAASKLDGSYQKLLLTLSKRSLLIIDDWGLEKLNQAQSGNLLEVLEDRYQQSSTIVISQLPVKEWFKMISNATVADAF